MRSGYRAGFSLSVLFSVGVGAWAPAAAQVDAADYITIRPGQISIILSVPHDGDKLFPGVSKRQYIGHRSFAVVRDQRTAELAEKLSAQLERHLGGRPYLVIARFSRHHIDANRSAEHAYTPPGDGGPRLVYDAYHKALADASAEVARRWGRGLLLDIHGQSRFPDIIVRGTTNGNTVSSLLGRFGEAALTGPTSIYGGLAALGYKIAPTGIGDDKEEKVFRGGYIVRAHGSGNGGRIDAIQVEVGSRFRAGTVLDRTARDLGTAIAAFAKAYLPAAPLPQD
jgi:N-formylglutamate amidohydrolase